MEMLEMVTLFSFVVLLVDPAAAHLQSEKQAIKTATRLRSYLQTYIQNEVSLPGVTIPLGNHTLVLGEGRLVGFKRVKVVKMHEPHKYEMSFDITYSKLYCEYKQYQLETPRGTYSGVWSSMGEKKKIFIKLGWGIDYTVNKVETNFELMEGFENARSNSFIKVEDTENFKAFKNGLEGKIQVALRRELMRVLQGKEIARIKKG